MWLGRRHQLDRPGIAVVGRGAEGRGLRADEVGQEITVRPAGAAIGRPAVEVAGVAAHVGHGIEAAGAADHATARPGVAAPGGVRLRLGEESPVDAGALQARPGGGVGDGRVFGLAASLDHADREVRILAEARRQHRAGTAGADDEVVERLHRSPSPGLRCGPLAL